MLTEEQLKLIPLYVGIIAAIAAIISKSPEFYSAFFATQRPSSLAKYNCLKVVQLTRIMLSDDEIKSLRKNTIYYALMYLAYFLAIYLYYQYLLALDNNSNFFHILYNPLITFSHPIKLLIYYINGKGNLLYAWLYIIFILVEIILTYKLIGSLITLRRVFLLSINRQASRMLLFKGACLKYNSEFMIILNNILNVLKYMNLRILEINQDKIDEDKFHIEVFTRKRFSSLCLLTIDICEAPEKNQIVAITIPVFDHPKYYEKVLRMTNRFISLAVLDL